MHSIMAKLKLDQKVSNERESKSAAAAYMVVRFYQL